MYKVGDRVQHLDDNGVWYGNFEVVALADDDKGWPLPGWVLISTGAGNWWQPPYRIRKVNE